MSKERISASVDPDVASYLNQDGVNASGTINQLVKQQMEAGTTQEELVRLRLEQEQEQARSLRQRLQQKEKTIEELEKRLDRIQTQNRRERELTIEEAAERLKPASWRKYGSKEDQIPHADTEEVRGLAKQTDMTPEELRAAVVDHILTEGDG